MIKYLSWAMTALSIASAGTAMLALLNGEVLLFAKLYSVALLSGFIGFSTARGLL